MFAGLESRIFLLQLFTRDTTCTVSCHTVGIKGTLSVYVQDAWKLKKKDKFIFKGRSDPYVQVTAVKDASHVRVTKTTSVKKNKEDATWNQNLYFGCGKWKHIDVSVWDEDSGSDDNLLPIRTFPICNSGECSVTYMHGESKLNFKIKLVPERNECADNPCRNGGTCRSGACGRYSCSCPPRYYGTQCSRRHGGGGGGDGGGIEDHGDIGGGIHPFVPSNIRYQ